MNKVSFKNKQISSLGFGCVKLNTHFRTSAALLNLETAFSYGITHFDTARMYGFGLSEKILGEFIKGKRDKVTITTKFGINPPSLKILNSTYVNFLKLGLRGINFSRKNLGFEKIDLCKFQKFSIKEADESFHHSLRLLQTDYIDFLLMHEADLSIANNPELLHFLENKKQQGKLHYFGIGTNVNNLQTNDSTISDKHDVIQYNTSFPTDIPNIIFPKEKLIINYNIFKNHNQLKLIFESTNFLKDYKKETGIDLPKNPFALIIDFHKQFENRVTLFTSNKNENIKETISLWDMPKIGLTLKDYYAVFIKLQEYI